MNHMLSEKYQWSVIGHEHIVKFLQRCLDKERLSHAYLFFGPAKVGKTTVAEQLIYSVYCQSETAKPCYKCPTCHQISQKSHPDVVFVERQADKKNITIEQIRELRSKLRVTSFLGGYKTVLIKRAETMSLGAANALLKTLEEPAGRALIIMTADDQAGLLSTIKSRAQQLRFKPVARKTLVEALRQAGSQAEVLAAMAQGKPGLALSLANDSEGTREIIEQSKVLASLITKPLYERWRLTNEYGSQGGKKKGEETREQCLKVLENLEYLWRDLYLSKLSVESVMRNQLLIHDLKKISPSFTVTHIMNVLYHINLSKKALLSNVSPLLSLETALSY